MKCTARLLGTAALVIGLVCATHAQTVLVTTNGHCGVINAIRTAMAVSGVDKLHAVLGGFHLGVAPPDYVEHTIAELTAAEGRLLSIGELFGRAWQLGRLLAARKEPVDHGKSMIRYRRIFASSAKRIPPSTRWTQNSEITDFIWLLPVKRRSRFS